MDSQQNNMERWLAKLGEARQAGAFESDAARYPWQNEQVRVQRPAHRRFAWLRIGGPVAAAAVVAVLFVRPNLFPGQTRPDIATTVHSHLDTGRPETPQPIASLTPSAETPECDDYNGDGLINGNDIQCVVDLHLNEGTRVDVKEFVQRCLLGG